MKNRIGIKRKGLRYDMAGRTAVLRSSRTTGSSKSNLGAPAPPNGILLNKAEQIGRMGSWEWDISSGRITWSEGYARMCGYDPQTIRPDVDLMLSRLIHPDDRDRVVYQIETALSTRRPFDGEVRFVRSTGEVIHVHLYGEFVGTRTGAADRMIGVVRDITPEKAQLRALERARQEQEALINTTTDLIWSVDRDLRLINGNKAYLSMIQCLTGIQLKGGSPVMTDIMGPQMRSKWQGFYDRALAGESFSIQEEVLDPRTGEYNYGTITLHPLRNDHEIYGVAAYSKDVTKEVMDRRQLQLVKRELDQIFTSSLDVICTIDAEGRFVKVSKASIKVWGRSPEDLVGRKYIDMVHQEDRAKTIEAAASIMAGNETSDFENRYIHRSGTVVPIFWSARWDDEDQLMYCVARNATDMVRSRVALQRSEEKYRMLFKSSPLPKFIYEIGSFRILDVNDTACKYYGFSYDEFLGMGLTDLSPVEEVSKVLNAHGTIGELGGTEGLVQMGVFTHRQRTGNLVRVEMNGFVSEFQDKPCVLAVFNDVTQREEAMAQLRRTEAESRTAQKLAKLSYWSFDIRSKEFLLPDLIQTVLEVPDMIGRIPLAAFIQMVHPEDRTRFLEKMHFAINVRTAIDMEFRLVLQNGTSKWVHTRGGPMKGERDLLHGTIQDVTDRCKLEALLENASRLARIGAYELDLVNGLLNWSPTVKEIHEVSPDHQPDLNEAIGFYKDDGSRQLIEQLVRKATLDGTGWDTELQIVTAQGNERWVRTIGEAEKVNGRTVRLYGSFQDIDRRKKAEIALQEAFDERSNILERIHDAFFALDRNMVVTYWNSESERLLQRSRADITGMNIWEAFPEARDHIFHDRYMEALSTQQPQFFEALYGNSWYDISAYPSENGLSIFFKDITDRKAAREDLRRSNERFQCVTKAVHDAIWDWDIHAGHLYWGDGFMNLFGHDVSKVPTLDDWADHIFQSDRERVLESLNAALSDPIREVWEAEYGFRKADGDYAHILDKGYIIRDMNGNAVRMVGALQDHTERKRYEESLKRLNMDLEEKVLERTHELSKLNQRLSYTNGQITDSIRYAKRIQQAILMQPEKITDRFPDSFCLDVPRDLVSGDFHWHYEADGKRYIAVADCTGHGVPGAMMSLIGNDLLNRAIIEEGLSEPAAILRYMDSALCHTLSNGTESVKDGMDIALCVIDDQVELIHFAGAFRPLVLIPQRASQPMVMIPGTRLSIGGQPDLNGSTYTTTALPFSEGDRIFLFSDGFSSQFGGTDDRKLLKRGFTSILKGLNDQVPMLEQGEELFNAFMHWKGTNDQVDDVLVVGIRL